VPRNWLTDALKNLSLPDTVLDVLVEHLGRDCVDSICLNRELGSYAVKLLSNKPSATAVRDLAYRNDPAFVDAILDTRERRDSVLAMLRSHWALPIEYQMRFVKRSLSSSLANEVLEDQNFCDAAKQIAAKRADSSVATTWLLESSLGDQEIFDDFLARLAKNPHGLEQEMLCLLALRPALRHQAANSTYESVKTAACWVEITDPADQETLAAFALEQHAKRTYRPLVGLIGQASLRPELRERLWQELGHIAPISQENNPALVQIYQLATPRSSASLWPTVPVAEVSDLAQLEMLAAYANISSSTWSVRYRQVSLLTELSRNAHLTEELRFRVMSQALALREGIHGSLTEALDQVVETAAAQLATEEVNAAAVVNKIGYAYGYHQTKRTRESRAAQVTRILELEKPNCGNGPTPTRRAAVPEGWSLESSQSGSLSPSNVSLYSETRAADLTAYLTTRLGDATTSLSQHAWRYFANMLPNVPREETFASLTESALLMAQGA